MGKVADVYKSGKGIKSKKNPNQIDYLRVAFLEWLLRQLKTTNKHVIWDKFLNDWSTIPEYELPINTHRPGTLHAYVKGMRNVANVTAARKEIVEVRAKLSEGEGGLKNHQTMLQYYLSSESDEPAGHRPKKQSKKQSHEEFIDQMKTNTQIQDFVRSQKRERDEEEDDQTSTQSSKKRARAPPPSDSFSLASNRYLMLNEEEG